MKRIKNISKCLLATLLGTVTTFIFSACGKQTESKAFVLKDTTAYISTLNSCQTQFASALFGEDFSVNGSKTTYDLIPAMLTSILEVLGQYSSFTAITDEDGNSVIQSVDYGFSYIHGDTEITVTNQTPNLYIQLKNATQEIFLEAVQLAEENYAISVYENSESTKLQVYFLGSHGRVKVDYKVDQPQSIFSITDFSNFATNNVAGDFYSNE